MSESEPTAEPRREASERPVLAAVDTSADSEAALLWACQYAEKIGVPVIALHVVHDPAEAPGYYRQVEGDALRPVEEVAKSMLDDFIADFRAAHPELGAAGRVQATLVRGLPATRIIETAQEVDARMIVMGSRGLTGLPHLLLGSKAERVVQLSSIPVTIVKTSKVAD